MKLHLYQIDAFATQLFEGNPAAVVPLKKWLPEEVMQSIAAENNLSETAFFVPVEQGYQIRWFTPKGEVDLCGHATLASAYVLFHILKHREKTIVFQSRS
ncbi:MAG: PhzF family phenazine biosynthesis protein, partial [Methanobacteriota archaeon]